jgi:hypothetical protein
VRAPKGGGSATTLYVDKEAQAYVGPTQTSLVGIGAVAIDDSNVYWTNTLCTHSVMKVAKTGGQAVTLITGQGGPDDIVVDATSVYWSTTNTIMKLTPK